MSRRKNDFEESSDKSKNRRVDLARFSPQKMDDKLKELAINLIVDHI